MSLVAILVGLGCGMLLAAMSFGLWSSLQEPHGPCRGAHAAAWAAASILVVAALLVWGSGLPALEALIGVVDRQALEGPALSLILMAALAIPLRLDTPRSAPWSCGMLYLPAGLLASMALVRTVASGVSAPDTDWVTPIRFSLAVCGGLGARAVGRSLQVMTATVHDAEWPGTLAYGLTTLVFGSAALVNLWQRGTLWMGANSVLRGGITGAWLAWSASWLTPRRYSRLRVVLVVVAAALLVLAAVKPA